MRAIGPRIAGAPLRAFARQLPDRAQLAALAEQLDRVALVDVPDQVAVDAVADQPAQARGEARRDLARDAELLVLLLAQEAGAVVHRDADAPLAGGVGPPAVPEAPVPGHPA